MIKSFIHVKPLDCCHLQTSLRKHVEERKVSRNKRRSANRAGLQVNANLLA